MSVRFVRFRQSPRVISRSTADEVLVNVYGREVHTLSGGAVTAWYLLDAPRTVPHLVDLLAQLYEVPRAQLSRDTESLVDDLLSKDLVEEIVEADV